MSALSRETSTFAVAIKAPDSGAEATGTVTQIASAPGTNGVDPQRFYLEVTPAGLDVTLAGASVVQTISVQTSQGEVLAVPVAYLAPDSARAPLVWWALALGNPVSLGIDRVWQRVRRPGVGRPPPRARARRATSHGWATRPAPYRSGALSTRGSPATRR